MSDWKSRSEALSLLGSATQFGAVCSTAGVSWPTDRELAEVLDHRAPEPDQQAIGTLQVQLWLGIRQMVKSQPGLRFVPSDLADTILILWEAAQSGTQTDTFPPWVVTSNKEMIAWLKECKVAGWQLVPPK